MEHNNGGGWKINFLFNWVLSRLHVNDLPKTKKNMKVSTPQHMAYNPTKKKAKWVPMADFQGS